MNNGKRFRPWKALVRRWERLKGWADSNRLLAFIGLLNLTLALATLATSALLNARSSWTLAAADTWPAMTTGEVVAAIDAHQVVRLHDHLVETGGWFNSGVIRQYIEVSFAADSQPRRVDVVGATSLETWKTISPHADARGVAVSFTAPVMRSAPVLDILKTSLVVALILSALCVLPALLGGGLVSKVSFKPDLPGAVKVLWSDVVGYEEVKRELAEVLDKMERAEALALQGIKAPKGVLLSGDPGVGKTMLGKAIATRLGAKFFYCTGASFVEMYVGVGAKRVRELFAQARRCDRAVVFIDEIDAIGSRGDRNSDTERLSTINQMLAEMDGLNGNGNILVLGATNLAERLDPALRRPGRFDKQIHVPLPDRATREQILRKYLDGVPLSGPVDVPALALRFQGYSGAQLAGVVREAKDLALREARGGAWKVSQHQLEMAQEIMMLGVVENKLNPEEARRIAFHELGHALVGHRLKVDRVEKVTLAGRGGALGYTFSRPLDERQNPTRTAMLAEVAMLLGGRAAEEVLMGAASVSAGAQNDLQRANEKLVRMVCILGMGPTMGLRTLPVQAHPGEPLPEGFERDVRTLLTAEYERALAICRADRSWMVRKAARLLRAVQLGHDELFEDLPVQAVGPVRSEARPVAVAAATHAPH